MLARIFLVLFVILGLSTVSTSAQFNKIKSKIKKSVSTSEQTSDKKESTTVDSSSNTGSSTVLGRKFDARNSDYLFMGKNGLDDEPVSKFAACIGASNLLPPMSKLFKQWITDISYNSALKMFNNGRCQVVGFHKDHNTGGMDMKKYGDKGAFDQIAAGNSIYKVETETLILVEAIGGDTYYIIISQPTNGVPKLENLNVCGPPPIIQKVFKAKRNSGGKSSYCHDLDQQIYKVKNPTKYAANLNTTSAVLFTKADYEDQKKKGLFKGKSVFILVNEETLEPVK